MNAEYQGAFCSNCGADMSEGMSACPNPKCGATARTSRLHTGGQITPTGEVSWMQERREIIRERPWIRWVLLVFDVLSLVAGFFVAQWIGAAIGLLLILCGELLGPKTIQVITRTYGRPS